MESPRSSFSVPASAWAPPTLWGCHSVRPPQALEGAWMEVGNGGLETSARPLGTAAITQALAPRPAQPERCSPLWA